MDPNEIFVDENSLPKMNGLNKQNIQEAAFSVIKNSGLMNLFFEYRTKLYNACKEGKLDFEKFNKYIKETDEKLLNTSDEASLQEKLNILFLSGVGNFAMRDNKSPSGMPSSITDYYNEKFIEILKEHKNNISFEEIQESYNIFCDSRLETYIKTLTKEEEKKVVHEMAKICEANSYSSSNKETELKRYKKWTNLIEFITEKKRVSKFNEVKLSKEEVEGITQYVNANLEELINPGQKTSP